jgi:hypothetical protein
MDNETKKIDIKEFREMGLLVELNRTFLHPLGLALAVKIDDDGNQKLDGILDCRDDPEGIIYDEDRFPAEKVKKAQEFIESQHKKRYEILGYVIQGETYIQNKNKEVSK